MKIQEIRQIAKSRGVDAGVGRPKQDIIRDIQITEGYSPCFGTKETCENDCLWKKDCTNNR
ncbi:MAG: SAP domain-containing protein [Deltaproteobacteria bacterium]